MAVSLLNGVSKVTGSAKAKTVTVEFDPDVLSLDQVLTEMTDLGYPATTVSSS